MANRVLCRLCYAMADLVAFAYHLKGAASPWIDWGAREEGCLFHLHTFFNNKANAYWEISYARSVR